MSDQLKKAQLVTWGMMGGIFIMGIVAWIVSEQDGYGASSEAKVNFLRFIVIFVGMIQIVMAGALRKIIAFSAGKENMEKRYLGAQVTSSALCEAPAVFGLILTFVSKSFIDFLILAVISVIALAVFFPRKSKS